MKLSELMAKYKKLLELDDDKSHLTIKAYMSDLDSFKKDFEGDPEINEITSDQVISYLSSYHKKGRQGKRPATTMNRMKSSIRTMFEFAVREYYLVRNPMISVNNTKIKDDIPRNIENDDMRKLGAVIEKDVLRDPYNIVFKTVIWIMRYMGLRVSEATYIKRRKIKTDHIIVLGKGNKERVVPITDRLRATIDDYLDWLDRIPLIPEDVVFINKRHEQISDRMVQIKMKQYVKEAEIKGDLITPHALRHTFATNYYRKTKDLKGLQDMLGHESLATTQKYTHVDVEEKKKRLEEARDEDL